MPAYNEEDYLADAVATVSSGLAGRGIAHEIVIVENGSTDATAEVARHLMAEGEAVRAVTLARANYGDALLEGFRQARGDIVVNFDVDYFDVNFIDAAVRRFTDDPALTIVVASKRAPGADDQRSALRRFVTWVFSLVLRYGFGLDVSDTHGMKALRREPILAVLPACRFGGDLFDTELILRTERAGLRVGEIPVVVQETRPSRTPILERSLRTIAGLARLRAALWAERVRERRER
ncbi:MAG: glycosyltransferase family 2 protein [Acidimicrobiia bacterium]